SPFDYLRSVRNEMNLALGSAHVKRGDVFTADAVNLDRRSITERLRALALDQDLPIAITVVSAEIADCDDDARPPTLKVVYRAITSWFPFHASQSSTAAEDIPLMRPVSRMN